jgi:hypothetical protein
MVMTSKEKIEKSLRLEKVPENVVTLEWWGLYKYEFAGIDYKSMIFSNGTNLSKVYENFYNYFKPDWFHLHIGTPQYFQDSKLIKENGESYLIFQDKYSDLKKGDKYFSVESADTKERVVDFSDYILESKVKRPKVDLSKKSKIDEFVKRYVFMEHELIIKLGYTDHVREISQKYGDKTFINVHIPSEICEIIDPFTGYVGFQEGLIAFHDSPEGMKYLIEKCYEAQLEWVKAFKIAGAHSFAISEDNMAADSVSPKVYREFLKPVHKEFFREIKNIGLFPLLTFWGDINPLLNDIREIGIAGLAVEESRKNYIIDIRDIIEKIGDRVCVFGNVDSVNALLMGNAASVEKEVALQGQAKKFGNFIFQNGSPITPGTPVENISAFLKAGREFY